MSSASTLREALAASTPCRLFGVHDGLSARLAQDAGVEGLWASGLGVSAAHAVPDASILAAADFLQAANSIVEATALPVVADCDSGFGDVNNVARTVRQFERAGVAAVCIEDKLFPKRNSFMDSQVLADPYEFAAKIAVAKQTQVSPSFIVWARKEGEIASVSRIFDLVGVVEHEDRELAAGRFARELRTSFESDRQPV